MGLFDKLIKKGDSLLIIPANTYKMGENMVITIFILFIAIMIGQILSYFILNKEIKFKYLNVVSIISIIIIYIIMAYFTYNPLKVDFFFDPIDEKYGINTYLIKCSHNNFS